MKVQFEARVIGWVVVEFWIEIRCHYVITLACLRCLAALPMHLRTNLPSKTSDFVTSP